LVIAFRLRTQDAAEGGLMWGNAFFGEKKEGCEGGGQKTSRENVHRRLQLP